MKRTSKVAIAAVLGASLAASMGFAASAFASSAAVADGTSWAIPAQKMTNTVQKDGKTYKAITTWASMWATNGPDYLGISNSCSVTSSNNLGTDSNTLASAQTSTMLGVWASEANESPNAYNWNMFYNLYEDAMGYTDKSDISVANNNWSTESGTMGPFKYRPEIIWVNSRLKAESSSGVIGAAKSAELIRNGQFYSAYKSDDDNTPSVGNYSCYGDSTYDPEYVYGMFMNSFTFTESFYDMAATCEKIISATADNPGTSTDTSWRDMNKLPRTTRYEESATECALNFEKISRGSLYYVLSKIADGTVQKKKVAFVVGTPDASSSTVTVIAHDFVGETAGRAAAGNDGGYPNISPIVVDQLGVCEGDDLEQVAMGGEQIAGNSDSVDRGGNSLTEDLTWATYTASADDLAKCDIVYALGGSMNKSQLQSWTVEHCTSSANATRAKDTVDYCGKYMSGIYIGAYTAEKLLVGAYAVNFFYPELFPNMELCAYWYDEVYHLKTNAVPTAMSWAFGNADLPNGTDLSNLSSGYSVEDMNAKFVEGYNYYAAHKADDPTISRILSGGSLVNPSKTYKFEYFEPSDTYAEWAVANTSAPEAAAQTVKISTSKLTIRAALSANIKASAKTALTFAKVSGNAKITVTKKGVVKVKKACKAGTYKIKVKATAKATDEYKKATATKTITVKVKAYRA